MIDRLTLVRHAESVFSVNGLANGDPRVPGPLTQRGREQAEALRVRLRDEPVDLCITTEFERVRETADVVFRDRPVERRVVPLLNDPRAGRFEGGPVAAYNEWHERADWSEGPPGGGDSQLAVVERYIAGYREILSVRARRVVVVAHALPIGFALAMTEPGAARLRRRYDDAIPLATPISIAAHELDAGLREAEDALARIGA